MKDDDRSQLEKMVQGGEDPQAFLRCRSFFAKEPLITRLFLRKMTCKDKASYGSSPHCSTKQAHTYICIPCACVIVRMRVCMCIKMLFICIHLYVFDCVYVCACVYLISLDF